MIRGHFSGAGPIRRPHVFCQFEFPGYPPIPQTGLDFLVDTGADRTTLSPHEAERLGLVVSSLDMGRSNRGIAGSVLTRVVECQLTMQDYTTQLPLQIPEIRMPVPAILGRDIMVDFALFMEERTGRVLLLNQNEVEGIRFSSLT